MKLIIIFIECSPIEGDNVDIIEPKAIYSIKPLIDTAKINFYYCETCSNMCCDKCYQK